MQYCVVEVCLSLTALSLKSCVVTSLLSPRLYFAVSVVFSTWQ